MKKTFLLLAFVALSSMPVLAQETENPQNSSKSAVTYDGSLYDFAFSWKKKSKKAQHQHWTGLWFAFVDLDGLKDAELKASQSYSIAFVPISYVLPLDHHWLFISGIGLDWTRYHFKGDIGLQGKSAITHFEPAPEGEHYKSSKLLTYYFTIPLVLEYQIKLAHRSTFHIAGGFEGLIKYYSKSQVDLRTPDGIQKTSLGRDLNLLPLNGRFVAQAGINDIAVFGYYQPFSMFKKAKGPDVKSLGFGLRYHF